MDRPTGRVIRRYEREQPGDLVHVDVKKLGRIPDGGGWRIHGCEQRPDRHLVRPGFDYIHSAVDDHSRLAYSEICADERGETAATFWTRAAAFFVAHGVVVQRVLTDNAWAYRALTVLPQRRARDRCRATLHSSSPAANQRQGGALQPDLARGMGLCPALHLQRGAISRLDEVAAHLQPSPRSHQSRPAPTHLTSQQRVWALQLDPISWCQADPALACAGSKSLPPRQTPQTMASALLMQCPRAFMADLPAARLRA